MNRERAIKIVAADLAATLIEGAIENWELYPEVGENDWAQIEHRAAAVGEKLRPHEQDVADARDLLASYAKDVEA